ncbi:hypothetical protein SASPL_143688 [Salvia splendens]|uniref:Pesticidal crystal cry8Ba protein n=1 Tax=Salvia splendens TaxID=180675 RepID=A0A8X8WN43_SALSN|nr:hypothetical protein SASPL_143688 [Salvia splendens]
MAKHKLRSDSAVGMRYRGNSLGLPSVSKFRSGHMPSVSRMIESLSDSMDTSDSEGGGYGARDSPEASPQDDKVANAPGNYYDRVVVGHRGSAYDESSESVTSSEVNSTADTTSSNSVSVEKRYNAGADPSSTSVQPNRQTLRQDSNNVNEQDKFSDDDTPSAPPLAGSFQHQSRVSKELPAVSTDENPCLGTSAAENESDKYKGAIPGAVDVETSKVPARNAAVSSHPLSGRYPTFHASGLGNWYAVLSYDASVRLCLHSWARGCMEAPPFLENECSLLRDALEEELMRKDPSELVGEGAFVKSKKTIGKIKVQVRKVKMGMEQPTGCTFTSLKSSSMVKLETFQQRLSNVKSIVSSETRALRTQNITPVVNLNGSLLHKRVAHVIVGTRRYLREVPKLIKIGFNAWRKSSSTYELVQESYSCLLRLKSSPEEDALRMQPGSGETRVFLPDGFGDDLIIEVQDSKGKYCGHALVQVADIADESGEKHRQCIISREPEHEQIGKIQLYINYSTTADENGYKCTSVAETIAYDCVLETAMKVQLFQQRNLLLHGSWKWLVDEFASYFGVSDAYTKLRYLSYVMDVATPTADCLDLVHDFLLPVVIKDKSKHTLSHQEVGRYVRLLGEVSDQIEQILTVVFENYKSLDESLPSGIKDVFGPATGVAAPALDPALKLYKMLHDILSPEVQLKLCRYFQNATRKRSRRHLSETDEFISTNNENILLDPLAVSTAYKKMKTLCLNIRNEILTDIEIHKQDLLPSFIDLPNLSSSIYSTELYNRLKEFLVSCPPSGPSPPVAELVVATADFQRDLSLWNISYIKGGVDAKELFHLYITIWIQDKRLALLDLCKLDRVKSASFPTTPFIDDIYGRIKETLTEYDVIISRWPEYTFALETAIADVEKTVVETLEKQYADVLSLLKENTNNKRFGLKYVQKFTKGNSPPYVVTAELGVLLNSMKRMLDSLRPQIEAQLKQWGSCMPEVGNMVPGEKLSEITVMIRSKFRAYAQAVVDKLVENVRTKLHNVTKLKKIIQDAKENVIESDLRQRMQPLKEMLTNTINQLHSVLEAQVFVMVCCGFWDRMGQDVLKFLEGKKENRSCYKASRVAVNVLDDAFASQMQQLMGNALLEKDLEPPRCILEVRSMLCKDLTNNKRGNYYY